MSSSVRSRVVPRIPRRVVISDASSVGGRCRRMPARFTRAEEKEWVEAMLERLERSERRRRPTDEALAKRATRLSETYLDGRAKPLTVRWVENQQSRRRGWGSSRCSVAAGMRLSIRGPDASRGVIRSPRRVAFVRLAKLPEEVCTVIRTGPGCPWFTRFIDNW